MLDILCKLSVELAQLARFAHCEKKRPLLPGEMSIICAKKARCVEGGSPTQRVVFQFFEFKDCSALLALLGAPGGQL